MVVIACGQSSIFAKNKEKRIISLAPAVTEILFSLGLDYEIIGVTTFCDYPPNAQNKEKVGSFSQPNIEKIISLKPDIIFATSLEQASVVAKLKQLRLNVYVSDPLNFEELFNSIKEIGRLTDREEQAKLLINKMKSRVNRIKEETKFIHHDERPRVFIEIWDNPLMTAGRGSFVDELITIAGGVNIAYDTPRTYSYFSTEQLLRRNPECIILGYMDNKEGKMRVKSRLGWENVSAVRNDRIYDDIDSNLFLRPGPRLVKGLEEIHKRLYSE